MSFEAIHWVFASSRAKHSALLVLLCLAHHARRDTREAWPSVATIAKETNLGERTVQGALAELLALGEVEEVGVGPHATRRFRLPEAPADPAPPADPAGAQAAADPPQDAAAPPADPAPELPEEVPEEEACLPAGAGSGAWMTDPDVAYVVGVLRRLDCDTPSERQIWDVLNDFSADVDVKGAIGDLLAKHGHGRLHDPIAVLRGFLRHAPAVKGAPARSPRSAQDQQEADRKWLEWHAAWRDKHGPEAEAA